MSLLNGSDQISRGIDWHRLIDYYDEFYVREILSEVVHYEGKTLVQIKFISLQSNHFTLQLKSSEKNDPFPP